VQNVKNLGGALVFITYFIFLDHPNIDCPIENSLGLVKFGEIGGKIGEGIIGF